LEHTELTVNVQNKRSNLIWHESCDCQCSKRKKQNREEHHQSKGYCQSRFPGTKIVASEQCHNPPATAHRSQFVKFHCLRKKNKSQQQYLLGNWSPRFVEGSWWIFLQRASTS